MKNKRHGNLLNCIYMNICNILWDEFSFIIFGKGPYNQSAVFLRHPASA